MPRTRTEDQGGLPDDAGHAGSYTRPQDTMIEPAHEADATGTSGGTRGSSSTRDYGLNFVLLLVVVGAFALLGYCGVNVR